MSNTIIETQNSALILHDLEPHISDLVKICVETVDAELHVNPEVVVFGKVCHQQRCVGFYSNTSAGYQYSSRTMHAAPLHPCLTELLDYINRRFNYDFNGILINKYQSGDDYIGKHSDDERGLDQRVGVVALSYGAVRKFRIRNKSDGKIVVDVPTDPTKILQMAGNFQAEFTHEIPIEKRINKVRYSFTFRKHI